ncbi:MAG: hypothetical protein OEM49_12425 [Myxococcales bacterium]|nr:hypothetical protein [Myxococcales bacterium]MDH5307923.1 hypothetical protein [Myxococcales bacterium]
MRPRSLLLVPLACLWLSAASSGVAEKNPPFAGDGKVVAVYATADGLRYAVKTNDGSLLDGDLDETQILIKYPELYAHVRSATIKAAIAVEPLEIANLPVAITPFSSTE